MEKATSKMYLTIVVTPVSALIKFGPDIRERLEAGISDFCARNGVKYSDASVLITESKIDVNIPVSLDTSGEAMVKLFKELNSTIQVATDHGKNSDLFNKLIDRYPGLRERQGFSRVIGAWDNFEKLIDEVQTKDEPTRPEQLQRKPGATSVL